jgi:hypothetical protein
MAEKPNQSPPPEIDRKESHSPEKHSVELFAFLQRHPVFGAVPLVMGSYIIFKSGNGDGGLQAFIFLFLFAVIVMAVYMLIVRCLPYLENLLIHVFNGFSVAVRVGVSVVRRLFYVSLVILPLLAIVVFSVNVWVTSRSDPAEATTSSEVVDGEFIGSGQTSAIRSNGNGDQQSGIVVLFAGFFEIFSLLFTGDRVHVDRGYDLLDDEILADGGEVSELSGIGSNSDGENSIPGPVESGGLGIDALHNVDLDDSLPEYSDVPRDSVFGCFEAARVRQSVEAALSCIERN